MPRRRTATGEWWEKSGRVENQAPALTPLSVILSDGEYFIQSMLATQLNHLVENDELEKNTVIKLTSFVINTVQNRK